MTKVELEEHVKILSSQLEMYKDQVASLKEEKLYYRQQVENLQNALMSIQAPDAYKDMKADEIAYPDLGSEAKNRIKQDIEIKKAYLHQMEQPLFDSNEPQEFIDILTKNINKNVEQSKSLHGNSES